MLKFILDQYNSGQSFFFPRNSQIVYNFNFMGHLALGVTTLLDGA